MDTVVVVLIVVVLVVAAAAAAIMYQRRRSARLHDKFGDEYDRTVREADDRRTAEKDLRERERRRSQLQVTPLAAASADRYREEWAGIQRRFVDQPAEAVQQADRIVVQMMRDSGYPVDDFDQRVDDISVDHPDVAQHYREAHAVAIAQASGKADTEQLRQAVTSYRQLVDALLRDSGSRDGAQS
jgi:hypothetical protein